MEEYDYECALSGATQEGGIPDERDGLEDLPVGWTQVTMKRRVYNPNWLAIQEVKRLSLEGLLAQMPSEVRETQGWVFTLQADATFHSLEKDTPIYITEEESVYISGDGAMVDSINEVREMLGMDPLGDEDEDEKNALLEDDGDDSHLPHDGEIGDDDDDDDEDDEDDGE